MITLNEASLRYGTVVALDDFTGNFELGAVTALVGGDGAGKSSLLRALAGLATFTTAQPTVPSDPAQIGYQPAASGTWRNLSVAENIEFVSRTYAIPHDVAHRRSQDLLDRAGLLGALHRPAAKLSGGMRQKLGFILATLHQPDFILLDEPTTGVDPVSRSELWSLIASAAAEGAAVVMATTYLDEAERAQLVHLLDRGKMIASGAPGDVTRAVPGTISARPVKAEARPVPARLEPRSWRRGATQYLWTPWGEGPEPEGEFETTSPDLENASIALLLSAEPAENAEPVPGADDQSPVTGLARTSVLPRPGAGPGTDTITVTNLTRRFGQFEALRGVTLQARRGEILGLLGGNGAGKTTLMRILLGLDSPTSGRCEVFGEPISRTMRKRVGYVAQGLGLYPSLTASENLEFAAQVHGVAVDDDARRFAATLGGRPVSDISLGAQRLLAFLAATQHRPDMLALDEPTSGMDALSRARLWRRLRQVADDGGTVLVTTHYMEEASQCDRLVVLTSGTVTATGSADDITRDRESIVLEGDSWSEAFAVLRRARLPVMLDGRRLRVPGVDLATVEDVLGPLAAQVTLASARSTLEETMMVTSIEMGRHLAPAD